MQSVISDLHRIRNVKQLDFMCFSFSEVRRKASNLSVLVLNVLMLFIIIIHIYIFISVQYIYLQ